jgi:hypothetical protein
MIIRSVRQQVPVSRDMMGVYLVAVGFCAVSVIAGLKRRPLWWLKSAVVAAGCLIALMPPFLLTSPVPTAGAEMDENAVADSVAANDISKVTAAISAVSTCGE